MVNIKKEGVILKNTKLEFENQAVMNPACIKIGNSVHMYYRAVRKGNYSSIGYCKLQGPLKVVERWKKPILVPELSYEKHGVEDPRIVFLDGIYYLFYTAWDGKNALVSYAISEDLKTWKKRGMVKPVIPYKEMEKLSKNLKFKKKYHFSSENRNKSEIMLFEKDAFLFPEKINGKYALLNRVLPDIHVNYFNDFNELESLDYWKKYLGELDEHLIIEPKYWFETNKIGGGCPPIKTDKGWLLIYHAAEAIKRGKLYRAAAALLDIKDPSKVIGRLDYPLFSPENLWERKGDTNNVVFPTGAAVFKDRLYIYYGAADTRIAVASIDLDELLTELLKKKKDSTCI